MASITLIDLLGTDNVALSRTDINKNFQTVENAVNTLETYLDTTPAGGTLSIGQITIPLGSNTIGTTLFDCAARGSFAGDLLVGQDISVTGAGAFGSLSVASVISADSAELKIGTPTLSADLNLRSGRLIDWAVVGEGSTNADVAAPTSTSGIFDVDVTSKRSIILDYNALAASGPATSNVAQLTGTPVLGQRLHITVRDYVPATATVPVYLHASSFHTKYDVIGSITPLNDTAGAVPVALAFGTTDGTTGSGTQNDLERLWVELVWNGTGWEVLNSHPAVYGI